MRVTWSNNRQLIALKTSEPPVEIPAVMIKNAVGTTSSAEVAITAALQTSFADSDYEITIHIVRKNPPDWITGIWLKGQVPNPPGREWWEPNG